MGYELVGKVYLEKKEFEGKTFYYKDFGSEIHDKPSFRLWVNRKCVQFDDEGDPILNFPITDAKVIKTDKGNYVLKSQSGYTTFNIYVPCGYRGGAEINILRPEPEIAIRYKIYESPRGSLGISKGMIVSVNGKEIVYEWHRSGRLYGEKPNGITKITADGKIEELENIDSEDLKDIEDLI